MTDLLMDLLIYFGFGIIMFSIGMIIGYQVLKLNFSKRFMVLAKECSDTDSLVPLVDELAKET
ncbi:hypothetical protein [Methanoregula sp.]|jgi:hypothetical protein|uniref:hypothetical protein n=1 Tax=Methanoregula sp. TaxID=2052170 RepID=UPI003562DAD3